MKKHLTWLALLPALALTAHAEVTLPDVFASGMVLQRETPVAVWGSAAPGETVRVAIADASAEAVAGTNGAWRVDLPAMPAGGPHTMTVAGKNTVQLKDVLVGEVWLCSGQSNMSHPIKFYDIHPGVKEDIAAADFPTLRLYCKQTGHRWAPCSPATLPDFSAVPFYFGRELLRELDVPVGLVVCAQIGSAIEQWIPMDEIEKSDWGRKMIEVQASEAFKAAQLELRRENEAWTKKRQMWEMSVAVGMEDSGQVPLRKPVPALIARNQRQLGNLFSSSLAPVIPYSVRGFAWYQGEANVGDADYAEKLELMVATWRRLWGQGAIPFHSVQIAPCGYKADFFVLPDFWEQQMRAAKAMGVSWVVPSIDIGEPTFNIHPPNKREFGRRLARSALANTYGRKDVAWSGPVFKSAAREGSALRLQFHHADGGLAASDGQPLAWFEVAGKDGKFASASAMIEGDAVVVSGAPAIAEPVAVRYAWRQTPGYTAGVFGPTGPVPNLVNSAGLPAYPFQTSLSH
ncbi:MAG: sialate O-acetylesterase [Lentisphaerae bacterium]|nr:sialate O-acetylesterase [Lentisphaerota bacterium]